jgi:hypothetical protein
LGIINNQFLFIFNGLCLGKAIFWEHHKSRGNSVVDRFCCAGPANPGGAIALSDWEHD